MIKTKNKVIFIVIAVALLILLLALKNAFAGFNFGYDTYNQVGNILIVNSTGDQTSSSTIGNLGTNDFIGELGVKNQLYLDGYTVAYDANNPNMNPQFASQYNTTLPSNVALTQLQFAGKSGDPRQLQNVYVLTSEYNKLSAEGQANSITTITNNLATETTNRVNGDTTLQNNINTEVTNRISGDTTLQNNINTEETNRINGDEVLQNNINDVKSDVKKETKQRKQADEDLQNNINTVDTNSQDRDNTLQKNINKETKQRKRADKKLQNNIDNEANTRETADNTLQNNITSVDNKQTDWNNKQDTEINNINQVNDRQDRDISNVSNRVSKLEKTQFMVRTELKLIREKHLEVGIYNAYSFTRNTCTEVGLNVVIPIGNSYLDRENKKINARLDRLDKQLNNSTVITRTVNTKGKLTSIEITDGQVSANGKF